MKASDELTEKLLELSSNLEGRKDERGKIC
jgi:hypothetical protein